jgi:hypothetical protein
VGMEYANIMDVYVIQAMEVLIVQILIMILNVLKIATTEEDVKMVNVHVPVAILMQIIALILLSHFFKFRKMIRQS